MNPLGNNIWRLTDDFSEFDLYFSHYKADKLHIKKYKFKSYGTFRFKITNNMIEKYSKINLKRLLIMRKSYLHYKVTL